MGGRIARGSEAPDHGAAANRRHAGQSGGSDSLAAMVAADREFAAAVAEVDGRLKFVDRGMHDL